MRILVFIRFLIVRVGFFLLKDDECFVCFVKFNGGDGCLFIDGLS